MLPIDWIVIFAALVIAPMITHYIDRTPARERWAALRPRPHQFN
jgi:hypothetical protein